MNAIETHGLTRHYGSVRALQELSLAVAEGEIFGFLGPNGAGKTTTIRLLLGLLRPTAGRASVLGNDPGGASAWRDEIGYLPGELTLWRGYSGAETLDFLARLTARPPVHRAALVERLGLSAADLARPVTTYSDGMKQKIGVVQAMQCAPRLLLLDEPTKGLDPLVQQAFYELLAEARSAGTTVLFSSHVLSEVERVCDRVAMLRAGRLVSVGSVDELRHARQRRVVVTFRADTDAEPLARLGHVVERTARRVVLLVPQPAMGALTAALSSLPVEDLEAEAPRLEDVFLEQYR